MVVLFASAIRATDAGAIEAARAVGAAVAVAMARF